MKHDFLDHHREGNSPVHQADPRLKIFMMGVFILVVVLLPYSAKRYFATLAAIPLIMAFISGVSIIHFFSKLIKLYPMIFLITFFLPFFSDGTGETYKFGLLNVYEDGLEKFFLINVKSILAIFMSIVMTTTTDYNLLLKGLEKFRIPKVIITLLSFMYRFIFLLIDETERMIMAFQSRYIGLPLVRRLKMVGQQIGVLFLRTYERSERIYQAMESRGFNGEIHSLTQLSWQKRDSLILAIFLVILVMPFMII